MNFHEFMYKVMYKLCIHSCINISWTIRNWHEFNIFHSWLSWL